MQKPQSGWQATHKDTTTRQWPNAVFPQVLDAPKIFPVCNKIELYFFNKSQTWYIFIN